MSRRRKDEWGYLPRTSSRQDDGVFIDAHSKGDYSGYRKRGDNDGRFRNSRPPFQRNVDTDYNRLRQGGDQLVLRSSGWGTGTAGYDFVAMPLSPQDGHGHSCSTSGHRHQSSPRRERTYIRDSDHRSSRDRPHIGYPRSCSRSRGRATGPYGVRDDSLQRAHQGRSRSRRRRRYPSSPRGRPHYRCGSRDRYGRPGDDDDSYYYHSRYSSPARDKESSRVRVSRYSTSRDRSGRRFRTPSYNSRYRSDSYSRDASRAYDALFHIWGGMEPSVPRHLLELRYVVRNYDIDLYNRLKAEAR